MKKNNRKWWIILMVLVAVLVWLWRSGWLATDGEESLTSPLAEAAGPDSSVVPDEVLVDLRNDTPGEEVKVLEKKYGLRLKPNSRFSLPERLYRATVRGRSLPELIAKLRAEPAVERAELDAVYGIPPLESAVRLHAAGPAPEKFPNDPMYRYQWHLDQIAMPSAWPRGTGKGVIVAVIDTGVAFRDRGSFRRVPDLAQTEMVPGYDFVNDNDFPLDDHGHGTHVAGTIAQSTNNGIGVAGVAYRARIMPLKVLSARGFGSVADIAEAIRFAADHGARVINMSLGGARSSRVLAAAVAYAHEKGVTVVCAAGNEGRGRVSYPAAYPGALAVAATQHDRHTTFYSNWGKEIDVAAPGGNTRVDQNGDGMPDGVLQNTIVPGHPDQSDYLLFMGTSMASPHVAGVAALVAEAGVTQPAAVERLLESTARHPEGKKRDDHYGAGIVDAAAALSKATTAFGAYRLGIAAGLALLLLWGVGAGRRLQPGLGAALGLLFGSAGLFFLPRLGAEQGAGGLLLGLARHGFPGWDQQLLGGGVANPLFHSLLAPLALALLLYGVARLRGFLFGFTLGVAGYLVFAALSFSADVVWIPNVLHLDRLWLLINAAGCVGIGYLLARR